MALKPGRSRAKTRARAKTDGAVGGPFVAQKRTTALASVAALKPQLQALAAQSIELTSSYATDVVKFAKAFVDDDKYSAGQAVKDAFAMAIDHWSGPIESLLQSFSSNAAPKLEPSRSLRFDLDEESQAADPQPIIVDAKTRAAVKAGRATVADLASKKHLIPSQYIRLSIAGPLTYVSLVGLGDLKLTPGKFSGPIRIVVPSKKKIGASTTTSVAVAELKIAGAPKA